jgi:hypothetical protein
MEVWVGLVSVVLGAAAGAIVTLVTTRNRLNLEQRLGYDRGLRDLRLPHYQRLYHTSGCIPREWRHHDEPSRTDLAQFREQFHEWYFGEDAGGMFLSEDARTGYFALQNQLQTSAQQATESSDRMSASESELLRSLASELRHQLRQDLGTGEPPQLKWTRTGVTPMPPASHQGETQSAHGHGLHTHDADL